MTGKLMKILSLLLLISVFAVSCKSKKQVATTPIQHSCTVDSSKIIALKALPDSALNNWYKIKGEAKVDFNNNAYVIDVQLRLKPNELIWISLSKAGFPVAKILLKQDSVYALDLFHKEYLATTYEELAEKIGVAVDFPIVQSVLLGQYIPFEDSTLIWEQNHELVLSNLNQETILTEAKKDSSNLKQLVWAQWLNCKDYSVQKQFIKTPNGERIWSKFKDLDNSSELQISKHIEVSASKQGVQKLFSTLDYDKIKSSKSLNIPFEIPSDYVEMD